MHVLKNFVLRREANKLVDNIKTLHCGDIGGFSIEITTNDSVSYDSYLYQGKTAEFDRDHDFRILEEMLKKTTD